MADTTTQTQPRAIPNSNPSLSLSPPSHLIIPATAPPSKNARLTIDTFSPVTDYGSYEFDRIIKAGEVLKRTRKTKSWKPIYIVLRPNLLSIYKDKAEAKLRHQINLSELTAVARQKDPKRKDKHIFALFSPSRNYHLEAESDQEAHDWVERIRSEAKIDEEEGEMFLASPGGATHMPYRGFERSIDANIRHSIDDRAGGYSSSDVEPFTYSQSLPRQRGRNNPYAANRGMSGIESSGAEAGSYSDFSDSFLGSGAARMSALSLPATATDGRPSTSSTQPPPLGNVPSGAPPMTPSGVRNSSQLSNLALGTEENKKLQSTPDEERVMYHGWIYLLRSRSKVRPWKKMWMVLRPKGLALYKNEEEYTALLILPFTSIIDVVEIDPISKSKTACLQIITEERNYRFCALDEEDLTRWLGAFKSLLSKRKTKTTGVS